MPAIKELNMPTFRRTIEIAASPERVWETVGDVMSVDQWIPGVTAVTPSDGGRVCTFDDGHVQHEQILDYSPRTRSFRYRIEGAPLPVRDNTGSFTVEDANGQARVVWESSFVALDPAMESGLAEMWEPYLPIVLSNLRRLIEDA
jgi:uncharacterized protein YndB with AHSA1/START domain